MKQRRAVFGIGSITVLLGLLSAGCGGTPTDPTVDDRSATRAAFLAARTKWTSHRISSYEYSFRRLCFCVNTEPVRITVRDGQVSLVVSTTSGSPVPPANYPDVDDLFAELGEALDENAHDIQATYHPALGYPTSLYIDLNERTADEEQRIEASALERLP